MQATPTMQPEGPWSCPTGIPTTKYAGTTKKNDGTMSLGEKTGENKNARQTANGKKELPGRTAGAWEGLPPTIPPWATLVATITGIATALHLEDEGHMVLFQAERRELCGELLGEEHKLIEGP
jgi:hypothetical protein